MGSCSIPNLFHNFAVINQKLYTMKKILILSMFVEVIFYSCKKKDSSPTPISVNTDPIACFTVDTTQTNDSLHLFTFTS